MPPGERMRGRMVPEDGSPYPCGRLLHGGRLCYRRWGLMGWSQRHGGTIPLESLGQRELLTGREGMQSADARMDNRTVRV